MSNRFIYTLCVICIIADIALAVWNGISKDWGMLVVNVIVLFIFLSVFYIGGRRNKNNGK